MDKIKKYLKENEEHLSEDKISDKVWTNVYQKIQPKRSFFNITSIKNKFQRIRTELFKKTRHVENGRYAGSTIFQRRWINPKWAFAMVVPLLFIFSCTYRVNRTEVVGSILSFDILKENLNAFQKITALQNVYRIGLIHFTKADDIHTSFISFIEREDKKTAGIINEVKQFSFISSLNVVPVNSQINESLFSVFLHKAFNVHLDARSPENIQVKRLVEQQLTKLGFAHITVEMSGNEIKLGIDTISVIAPPVQSDSIRTISVEAKVIPPVDTLRTITLQPDTVVTLMADEKPVQVKLLKTGQWNGQLIGDTLAVQFYEPKPSVNPVAWLAPQKYAITEIGITTLAANAKKPGNVRFEIKKEWGTIRFKVIVLNTNNKNSVTVQDAVGSYEFEKDASFSEYLKQNGFRDLTDDILLLLFVTNTGKQSIQDLKAKGYNNSSKLYEYLISVL